MSLNKKIELQNIAKIFCRELRKNQTRTEKILWQAIRNEKLLNKKFRRQHPIFHDIECKESFFILDFYCYENKLGIELDGAIHQYKLKEDEHRTKILNSLGIKIMRFRNYEIENNLNKVLLTIRNELNS